MDSVRRIWNRIAGFLRKPAIEQDMDSEMRFHIDMLAQEFERSGMTAEDARLAARRRFGNVTRLKEQGRDVKGGGILDELRQDLFYGFRKLLHSPGFSLLAIGCLTLGIGANTAVFSWIEGMLLRPYPQVANQERLFVVGGTEPGASKDTPVSWPDFLDYRKNSSLIDAFIADKIVGATLSVGGDRAERIPGSVVSANYFDALGVRPILGRGFEPEEEVGRNAHPVVVISYQLWQERFKGDPGIIGRKQVLNAVPFTIVGVAPEGFYGTFVGYSFKFWIPASMQGALDPGGYKLEDRGARWIEGFARLKPGVTREQAQLEMSAVAKRLEADYPATNRARGIHLVRLWQSPFNAMDVLGPTLGIALVVVIAVLLIACANVGNLLLLKSFARRRELTIRLAVGAGRVRLIRQLLTEGLILSILSAACGFVLAYWSRDAMTLLIPIRNGVALRLPAELDWRVLALTAAVSLASTLLFGLAPAVITSKVELVDALKSEAGAVVGGRGKVWVRSALVLVQISLSFILLVGMGLVIESLARMRATSPGFSADRVLTTAIDLTAAGYDTPRKKTFQDEILRRIQAINGVESAAFARTTPFTYSPYSSAPIAVDGYETRPDEQPAVDYNDVGPGYFATMGILLLDGREFTRDDNETSAPVAVVNETMAAQYWRGESPLGKRLQVKGRSMRVVGVAKVAKYRNFQETPKPFFYVPMLQNAIGQNLMIRTLLPPATFASMLVREIHALDPGVSPLEVITMREQVDRMSSAQTVAARLLGIFGGLALLLAAIGLYGVMSFSVAQSGREIGLRMALGANRSVLLRLVLSHGLSLTAGGILLGTLAAFGFTRLFQYVLYDVSPRDPVAFAAAFVVMLITSTAACLLPASRAIGTDPIRALRD
jgi:macrolide transport system ATP-binding/permease protein